MLSCDKLRNILWTNCVWRGGVFSKNVLFKNELDAWNIYIQQAIKTIKLIFPTTAIWQQNELNWRSQNWTSGSDWMYVAKEMYFTYLHMLASSLELEMGMGRKVWEPFHQFQMSTQILILCPLSRKTLLCKLRRTTSCLLPSICIKSVGLLQHEQK